MSSQYAGCGAAIVTKRRQVKINRGQQHQQRASPYIAMVFYRDGDEMKLDSSMIK